MTRNHTADAQTGTLSQTASRVRLARAPGILFLTAALVLPLSGVMALDAPQASLPPEPSIAPAPAPSAEPAAPAERPVEAPVEAPAEAVSPTSDTSATGTVSAAPLFTSGDRLDADQRAEFLEWVAAQRAAGQHRGVAVYASW